MQHHQLDIRGELCPYTLINTKKRMAELAPGDLLEIRLDNPEATQSIPNWAKHAGHKLIAIKEEAGSWVLLLEKSADSGAR